MKPVTLAWVALIVATPPVADSSSKCRRVSIRRFCSFVSTKTWWGSSHFAPIATAS